jgi:Cdc6-like AAA superfamily ATPase
MSIEGYVNQIIDRSDELRGKIYLCEKDFAILDLDISSIFRRFEHPVRSFVASTSLLEESLHENYEWLDQRYIEFSNSELFPILLTPPGNKTRAKRQIKKTIFGREQPIISIEKILSKGDIKELIRKELLADIGYDLISPYRVDTTTPARMFFGRGKHLNRLRRLRGNLVVYGPRRIGKSTLVLQLQKELGFISKLPRTNKGSSRPLRKCAYVDVSALGASASDEIWGHIIKSFGLDAHSFYKYYGRKVRLTGIKTEESNAFIDEVKSLEIFISSFEGQLTIILDEVDGWIEREALSGWTAMDRLRALTDRGKANVILVGYETLQAAAENHRFPLYNRGDYLHLGPLNRDAVKDLILTPLAELKIKLSPENEIIERIWQASSGFPHLVQDICKHIVEKCLGGSTKKYVVDNNLAKAAIDDSEAFATYRRGVINSDFPLAEAIAGLTCLSAEISGRPDASADAEYTISDDEIVTFLEQANYVFDGKEYDLALSYLELRSIIRPVDSTRSTWTWVNKFARMDMQKKIKKLGFIRWRDGVMRQHREGSWKAMYKVLGRLD